MMERSLLTCLGVLLLSCQLLLAQQIVLLKDEEDVELNSFAYTYMNQNASPYSIETVLQADSTQFVKNAYPSEISYGFHQPRGWCKFFIRNTGNHQDWILKIQQARVDTVQLYIARENQPLEKFPVTGHFQTLSQRPVHALPFAYPITIKKNETIGFYLYTQRQFGRHAAILNFQHKDYFEKYEHNFNMAIAFVCGMVLLAGAIGFFFFVFVRQRVYVYFSIYALSIFVILLVDTGIVQGSLSLRHFQTVANGLPVILFYWVGGWHILFSMELLRTKQYGKPWAYWSGRLLAYFYCGAAFLLFVPILPHPLRSVLMNSYYLLFFSHAYILYAVSICIFKKDPIVYFYIAGFYFIVIAASLFVLWSLHIVDIPNQYKDLFYFTPLVEILCVVAGIGIHFSQTLKERVHVQMALTKTQDQIITIQEDERRRIAQDLHDDVGNSLAAIKNMVVQQREPGQVEKEIDNLVGTVRTISHDLMPVDFNRFSLKEIISHTVNKFENHPSIEFDFDCAGKETKMKPQTEIVIYRIINELITNILKHSRATKALIQLFYQADSLVVTVEDNGIGMKDLKEGDGIGLRSVRLRATYINAKLHIESSNKGTEIILEIPYEKII
jgi:signal transduction histidine kinase